MTQHQNHLELISAAVEYIEAHLTDKLTVEKVCDQIPLSQWQFQRLFRAWVGDSIGNYIRGRRLSMAAARIKEEPALRVLDLALDLQFGSHEALTRAFKSAFGVTPLEHRKSSATLRPFMKPRLDREKISRISTMALEDPVFVQHPHRSFVGMSIEITSPLGVRVDFDAKLLSLWKEFNLRRHEIEGRIPRIGYGIPFSNSDTMEGELLTYYATAEVIGEGDLPPGMVRLEAPAQTYAVFQTRGRPETTFAIGGIWFPQSGYRRAKGLDLDVIDHRYRLDAPEMVSHYCVPIEKS